MAPELTYSESIAGRGGRHPEQRAALSEDLFSRCERLLDVAIVLREALVLRLECQPEHKSSDLPLYEHQSMAVAIEEFDEARARAFRFLAGEGHSLPDEGGYAEQVWDASREADAEALADAVSAFREGFISRQKLEETRQTVIAARGRLDIAVAQAVAGEGGVTTHSGEGGES